MQKEKKCAENYKYGLSSLHCWIRSFETLLHIGYKLAFKSWVVRGAENKANLLLRKREIQEKFKSKMRLLIDIPKPGYGTSNDGNTARRFLEKFQEKFKSKMELLIDIPKPGYGTSNDGNTARRFFADPKLSSKITGIEKQLIFKNGLILKIIASGKNINIDKFELLTKQARDLYIEHYNWYYMPSTLHKLLVPGVQIRKDAGHISETIYSTASGKKKLLLKRPREIAGNYFQVRKTVARGRKWHGKSEKWIFLKNMPS